MTLFQISTYLKPSIKEWSRKTVAYFKSEWGQRDVWEKLEGYKEQPKYIIFGRYYANLEIMFRYKHQDIN